MGAGASFHSPHSLLRSQDFEIVWLRFISLTAENGERCILVI